MFVAVGHDGFRVSSADGLDWKDAQTGKEGEVYRAVASGNGACVAVGTYGGRNLTASTKDGAVWTTGGNDARYVKYYRGLCFGAGEFIALGGDPGAVGSAQPFIATSADGVTWSEFQDIPGKWMIRRVAFGNDLFIGVGDRGRRACSKDALHWDDAPDVKPLDTLIDIAFGNDVFVGVGLHGLRMMTEDGLAWSAPLRGPEGEHMNSIVWAGGRFVAVGAGATYFSPDGAAWERQPNRSAPLAFCHGQGTFIGTNWKGRILRSTNAVEWTQVYQSEHHIEAVAYGALVPSTTSSATTGS